MSAMGLIMQRDPIPESVRRAVLIEAGHRCAIPTCRATTTEIAHIIPWNKSKDNSFDNLIALCPNCHTRYDEKKEIDTRSMKIYKHDLGLLTSRYSDFERRTFEYIAITNDRLIVVSAGFEIALAGALADGFLENQLLHSMSLVLTNDDVKGRLGDVHSLTIPLVHAFWVTDLGLEFVHRYASGLNLD